MSVAVLTTEDGAFYRHRGFDAEAWGRTGTANDVQFTARAIAYIIAGHERHHLALLRSKYL